MASPPNDQGSLLLKKQLMGQWIVLGVLGYLDNTAGWLSCISLPLLELQKKPVEGFSAGLIDDDDIYEWDVMIIGPPDTF
jgi:hypothetical protein